MNEANEAPDRGKLASTELAELVADALLRAGLLKEDDTSKAIEIVAEEIEVRKALGDYRLTW